MYRIMKKWDSEHSEIARGFKTMTEANDEINRRIDSGELEKVESENREYYILPEGSICPRCKENEIGYPAISRSDNKTEVCSDCGTWEALYQFSHKGQLPEIKDGRAE